MNVCFACPVCAATVRVDLPGAAEWKCPGCDHLSRLAAPPESDALGRCVACGNAELYRKKDFPHAVGLGILCAGFVAFLWQMASYRQWWAWSMLLGSWAIDALLYRWVGDVVVCYRCNAHHRGFAGNEAHRPFELTVHERYRQERIRRELAGGSTREKAG